MNRESVFEWHKRFKKGRESARDDERCGGNIEVNRVSGISTRTIHQSTTPSLSQTISPRWVSVPQPPYSPNIAPCDFRLFPKLRGCRYERNEEMKEAVTKVIDTLTPEDIHGAFHKV